MGTLGGLGEGTPSSVTGVSAGLTDLAVVRDREACAVGSGCADPGGAGGESGSIGRALDAGFERETGGRGSV